MKRLNFILVILLIASLLLAAAPIQGSPPPKTLKLIFIHHSTGENWLMDDYGNLGRALGENNYFVSDTNYGWGPDSIGDNTDIPNWVDWFASEESPRYLEALYHENGQHSDYTRSLADPGGENQIILFKSCFPNSALEGNPNDPPNPDGWLSVGHAKYVYNTILEYFGTRPDKLFIVITAPPLSDSSNAANARAFNDWLVNDWLADYPLRNVAVFDFHAVLSGPNNRHRLVNGQIEHVTEPGMNTLYYPSDDDHPSARGSQKATGEFLPLLNYYVERWQAGDTSAPPMDSAPPVNNTPNPVAVEETLPNTASAPFVFAGFIDDFEGGAPTESYGWEAFTDETEPETRLSCAPSTKVVYEGAQSLKIDYDVVLYSWATCDLTYENDQNWSDSEGVGFYVYATQENTIFDVNVFVENDTVSESYVYQVRLDSYGEYKKIGIPWSKFKRVDWEENSGSPFNDPEQIHAIAFGFNTPDGTEVASSGTVYIDALAFVRLFPPETTSEMQEETHPPEPAVEENQSRTPLPCVGGLVLPAALGGWALKRRKVLR